MNRDEPCHKRGGTVDNLGDPGCFVLNRLMSPVVLKCLKQPGLRLSNTVVNRNDAGSSRVSTGTASERYRCVPGTSLSPP